MISGERLAANAKNSGFEQARHMAAYSFARRLAKGKSILDIGCGEGYGTHLLADGAAQACGLDYSEEAVENARRLYRRPNLEYRVGDATKSGLPSGTFDYVCAFQIVEHFERPEAFLQEARRLVKPGGSFIVSTLNRTVSGSVFNPYHPIEYDKDEFMKVLQPTFSDIELFGVHGSERAMRGMRKFKSAARFISALDIFGLKRFGKLLAATNLYGAAVSAARAMTTVLGTRAEPIGIEDFEVTKVAPETGIDFIALCRKEDA